MKSDAYSIRLQRHALMGGDAPVNPPDNRLYLTLHSEDPRDSGVQDFAEIKGISRVSFEWSDSEWTNDGTVFSNKKLKVFPAAKQVDAQQVVRFWSIGYAISGPGEVLITGEFSNAQEIVAGLIIEIKPGMLRSREF